MDKLQEMLASLEGTTITKVETLVHGGDLSCRFHLSDGRVFQMELEHCNHYAFFKMLERE